MFSLSYNYFSIIIFQTIDKVTMLKQYKILLSVVLCMSSTVMYGTGGGLARCDQIIMFKLKEFFGKFVDVAKQQQVKVNKTTTWIHYYPNSKSVTIFYASNKKLHLEEGPTGDSVHLLKGVRNNFYDISNDYCNHPLYSFLRDHGVIDRKNAPGSLPKTIM